MLSNALIDKAYLEFLRISNAQAYRAEIDAPKMHDTPKPVDYRISMRAVLEAVAAQLWDDGYQAAVYNNDEVCNCNAWNWGECACGNYANPNQNKTNPYKETT